MDSTSVLPATSSKYHFPHELFAEIHNVNMADVISDVVQLKQNGKGLRGLCPLHSEKTPSFYVFPERNRFKCYGCGKSGDLIDFVRHLKGCNFVEAVHEIASKRNIIIERHDLTEEQLEEHNRKSRLYITLDFASRWFTEQLNDNGNLEALYYLKNRWGDHSIENWRLGFAPQSIESFLVAAGKEGFSEEALIEAGLLQKKDDRVSAVFRNRIMFPLMDKFGRICGFSGRALEDKEGIPKYKNSQTNEVFQKAKILFGLHQAATKTRECQNVYMVEGYADVIRLHENGITNTVGICGTSLTEEHLSLLKSMTNTITLIGDTDTAGKASVQRSAVMILKAGLFCKIISLPDGESKCDPDSFFSSGDQFTAYESTHRIDYLHHLVKCKAKSNMDPDQQIRLILEVVGLLVHLPDNSHELYIKDFAKKIPPRKPWIDALQKLTEARDKIKTDTSLKIKNNDNSSNQALQELHDFYTIELDRYGNFKSLRIHRVNFIERLKYLGFLRYDLTAENSRFVQITNNIVTEVTINNITDRFIEFINNLQPLKHELPNGSETVDSTMLIDKMYIGLDSYFSKNFLNRLTPDQPIVIKKDNISTKYFYYLNGFVSITKEGPVLHPYNELDGYVWASQILNRSFHPSGCGNTLVSPFQEFVFNICGANHERFQAMKTIMGYIMHNFLDCRLFAIILTDARLSLDGEPNGRTGKTLWGVGIGQMLNAIVGVCKVFIEIAGKDFKPQDKFKYSQASIDTQVIHINDIFANFNIETAFNDITEGIDVDKKNEKPFRIKAKLIFSTNKTIKIEGESAKDRVVQFEFADHYSSNVSPETEFGHRFFRDWDPNQWNAFDEFMISCVHDYLQHGLIRPVEINLGLRELIDHTNPDFVNFMDDCLKTDTEKTFVEDNPVVTGQNAYHIIHGELIPKKRLYDAFINNNNDYQQPRFPQCKFTKYVRKYCKNKQITLAESRSNSIDYFTFTPSLEKK